MKDIIVLEKSYNFALRIVKLYIHLRKQKVERELLIHLLKSATSIGANIEEAVGAQSKNDFTHKIGIAYKESRKLPIGCACLKMPILLKTNFLNLFY